MRRKEEVKMPCKRRKRPCRICGKWYVPDPRSREHQKTCGRAECKREWHRKKCAEWNAEHMAHFKAIYLARKLTACRYDEGDSPKCVTELAPPSQRKLELPRREVQEVTGAKLLVIIEYLAQLLIQHFQEVKRVQPVENKGRNARLPPGAFSRGDG